MNLIEAVKSGKRFRRRSWSREFKINDIPNGWHGPVYPDMCLVAERFDDLIADDWEIEEKRVEVTRKSLGDAIWKGFAIIPLSADLKCFNEICRELGLDES